MIGAKKDWVLNRTNIVPKRKPGPTSEQEAGRLAGSKKLKDSRFAPDRRGKFEVGVGKLHRKGFKK